MIKISKGEWQGTKAELDAAVVAHRAAVEAHKNTVGQPAPLPASEAVERIVRRGEVYTFEEEVTLPPTATLDEARAEKRKMLAVASKQASEAGIASSVLGLPHTYPTTAQDQFNLYALIARAQFLGAAGEPYKFWCADSATAWARRGHTVAQIQQLGLDVSDHVIAQQDRHEQRLGALAAATTKEEVAAITW